MKNTEKYSLNNKFTLGAPINRQCQYFNLSNLWELAIIPNWLNYVHYKTGTVSNSGISVYFHL